MLETVIGPIEVIVLGMPLERWEYQSCTADFGIGEDSEPWATLYNIQSSEEGKGHAAALLRAAKEHYVTEGRKVGGSVAIHPAMKHLYRKLGYIEYDNHL